MTNQTVTRAIESELEPASIYKILADATNIPKWATIFADAIERVDDTHYQVTKNGEKFDVQVFLQPSVGTVDYIRQITHDRRGGAYIRVTPRPLGGSTITMTVPTRSNTTSSQVARTLEQELDALIRLAGS